MHIAEQRYCWMPVPYSWNGPFSMEMRDSSDKLFDQMWHVLFRRCRFRHSSWVRNLGTTPLRLKLIIDILRDILRFLCPTLRLRVVTQLSARNNIQLHMKKVCRRKRSTCRILCPRDYGNSWKTLHSDEDDDNPAQSVWWKVNVTGFP